MEHRVGLLDNTRCIQRGAVEVVSHNPGTEGAIMKRLMKASALMIAIGLGVSTMVLADDEKSNGGKNCTVATLDGLYVFAASGFIIPASGPAQPKAIVEWIRFNGDGTVFVAGATRSLNGVVAQIPGGGGGSYTVTDLVPPDGGCAGTLTFAPLTFDLFIQSKGEEKIWIIQTNPNNVFQGTATRVAR
jgi:hypothetical protein